MTKKDCSPGQKFDSLINACFPAPEPEPEPTTEPPVRLVADQVRVAIPTPPADSVVVVVLSPVLWICVVLATVGFIVALALWFVIYKRQTRLSSAPEDAEPGQEPPQKTEPPATTLLLAAERNGQAEMFQRAVEAPSPCPHPHLGAQTGLKWEGGYVARASLAAHAGMEGGGGLPACSTVREHRVPLPATELGGTALVTTKTV